MGYLNKENKEGLIDRTISRWATTDPIRRKTVIGFRGGKGGNPQPIGGERKVQLIMFTYLYRITEVRYKTLVGTDLYTGVKNTPWDVYRIKIDNKENIELLYDSSF